MGRHVPQKSAGTIFYLRAEVGCSDCQICVDGIGWSISQLFGTPSHKECKLKKTQRSESFVWSQRQVDSSQPFALHQQIL